MTQKNEIKQSFPLLPYSRLVWDLMQLEPEIYNFRFALKIPKQQVDTERLKQALCQAFANHPVFYAVTDENGRQTFCESNDILHGQFHSIDFSDENDYLSVSVKINRILGDGASVSILLEDWISAYQGLPLEKDCYIEYLTEYEKTKQTDRYFRHKQWLEQHFSCDCPVHPFTDIPLTEQVLSYEAVYIDDYAEMLPKINDLSDKYVVSFSAIFSLAACLAIMEYNNTDSAALTWAYQGREKISEQRIFGSLHRDIPLLIKKDNNKENLLKQIRQEQRNGIAHSIYPYTLSQPWSEKWNYAVNVLEMQSIGEQLALLPFQFELSELETNKIAYSLLDIEINNHTQPTVLYRYSSAHYKETSIRRFADLIRKNIEWLVK